MDEIAALRWTDQEEHIMHFVLKTQKSTLMLQILTLLENAIPFEVTYYMRMENEE